MDSRDIPPVSKDGRFWWDGRQWVPFTYEPTRKSPLWAVGLMLFVFALAILAGISMWQQSERDAQTRKVLCEAYGEQERC